MSSPPREASLSTELFPTVSRTEWQNEDLLATASEAASISARVLQNKAEAFFRRNRPATQEHPSDSDEALLTLLKALEDSKGDEEILTSLLKHLIQMAGKSESRLDWQIIYSRILTYTSENQAPLLVDLGAALHQKGQKLFAIQIYESTHPLLPKESHLKVEMVKKLIQWKFNSRDLSFLPPATLAARRKEGFEIREIESDY